MESTHIIAPNSVISELKSLMNEKKKIVAIKLLRDKGRLVKSGARTDSHPGLRQAKEAVEHLVGQTKEPCAIIVPNWDVHSLLVTGPAGERIELNVDELQMHFLSSLHSVGLAEVSRLMELVDFIKAWTGRSPDRSEQVS